MSKKYAGHMSHADGSHSPLTREDADVLLALAREQDDARKSLMPDSMSALRMMTDAKHRLRDEGWRDAKYCPKDGETFAVIEYGSSGIFEGSYWGAWPDGKLYVCDGFTHPHGALFKPLSELTNEERSKLDECMKAERAFAERQVAAFINDDNGEGQKSE